MYVSPLQREANTFFGCRASALGLVCFLRAKEGRPPGFVGGLVFPFDWRVVLVGHRPLCSGRGQFFDRTPFLFRSLKGALEPGTAYSVRKKRHRPVQRKLLRSAGAARRPWAMSTKYIHGCGQVRLN